VSASTRARTLELFFIDGRPDGMLTAEVFNWTGHVLVAPRTQIREALHRDQAHFTGVYLLLGEINGRDAVYIGEADDVSSRIRNHDTGKEWWTTAVIITSTSNSLNKAHARYLEARLITEASKIGRAHVDNSTAPGLPVLSEAAQANMEGFLEYVLMILPALRIDSFLQSARPAVNREATEIAQSAVPQFELEVPTHGIRATAELRNGEFVVLEGSSARTAWTSRKHYNPGYQRLHGDLKQSGVLQPSQGDPNLLEFTENYAFNSPSAAAAVINGRPTNGTTAWKVHGQNKTYKQWEAEQLAREIDEPAS
jgi:predicted GIY-YIG superfamily endonuclease